VKQNAGGQLSASDETYIGDVIDIAGLRQQLDALCMVSLHSQVQSTESSARA